MTNSTPHLIPLYRRSYLVGYALVDADDYERFKDLSWYLDKKGYVVCKSRSVAGTTLMHRMVMDAQPGEIIDHANHVRSDNRKANLRSCTASQNSANTRKFRGQYGMRGIWKHNINGTWRAAVTVNGETHMMSGYKTPEEAARIYDALAQHYHGEFAILNFPEEIPVMPEGLIDEIERRKKAWGNRTVTAEQLEELRAKRLAGSTAIELAEEFGLEKSTVFRLVRDVPYTPPPLSRRRKFTLEQIAEIRERYANGEKQRDIGADFGVRQSVISYTCAGVERKKKE